MLSHWSIGLLLNSAKDPTNFDADPDPDPGSALEKNGFGYFLKIYWNFLTKQKF